MRRSDWVGKVVKICQRDTPSCLGSSKEWGKQEETKLKIAITPPLFYNIKGLYNLTYIDFIR